MKLHQKITALLCSTAMIFSMAPSVAASEEQEDAASSLPYASIQIGNVTNTKKGDDNNPGLSDIVTLKRYLLGEDEFTKSQFQNGDTNLDGKVNGLDLAILRDFVLKEQPVQEISYSITPCEYTEGYHQQLIKEEPYVTITSYEEKKKFYADVFDTSFMGAEKLYEKYVESLCPVWQGYGGPTAFHIDRVQYQNGNLEVHYYEQPTSASATDVINPQMGRILIPKSLYHGEPIVWIEDEGCYPIHPVEARTDSIQAATENGWRSSIPYVSANKGYTINDADQLNRMLSENYSDAVVRSFTEYYDEAFFEENVLFLKSIAKNYNNDYTYYIDSVLPSPEGSLEIIYEKMYINGFNPAAIDLLQVAIPKEQWNQVEPEWIESDASEWVEECVSESDSVYHTVEISPDLVLDDKYTLHSYEELVRICEINQASSLLENQLSEYDEAYFENHVLELIPNTAPEGKSIPEFASAQRTTSTYADDYNYLEINVLVSNNARTSVVPYLQIIEIPHYEYGNGCAVSINQYHIDDLTQNKENGSWITYDLDVAPTDIQSLIVNQYTFRDKSSVAIYLKHKNDPQPELIEEYAVATNFTPFESCTANMDGSYGFLMDYAEITSDPYGMLIRFRTDPNTDEKVEWGIVVDYEHIYPGPDDGERVMYEQQ